MHYFYINKSYCKFLFCLICSFFCYLSAEAQIIVQGKVMDEETKSPIEGVSLQIRYFDTELGTFTDNNGFFRAQLKKGVKYNFTLSFVGKDDYETSIVSDNDTTINFYMRTHTQMLGEVVVETKKKLIESKIDRLVYNVNNDPLAKSLTTEELIKRIPLLRLRDNSLSIIGKGSVVVSVDGKLQQINSNELLSFLNNFDPTNLKSIEVITSPPSNFSAEGNAGILNIVTNRAVNDDENWNASIRSAYVQRSVPGTDNGISFNYNKSRFSASANINYTLTQLKADLLAEGNNVREITNRKDKGSRFGTYLNLNFKPSAKHDLSGTINFFNTINRNEYSNERRTSDLLITNGNRRNEQSRFSTDINYIYKLDSTGKSITTFVSYNSNLPKEKFYSSTFNDDMKENGNLNSFSNLSNRAFSAQIDAHLPYSVGEFDYGVQFYTLKNDATIEYLLNSSSDIESYLYKEKNYAAYASFTTKSFGRFTFKGGLRYELNEADLTPDIGDIKSMQRKKGNLFPTMYGLYTMKNGGKLSVNYTKRINRPGFTTITPIRWYNNIYTYVTGNPLVQPYISDNIQLNYSKGDLYFSVYSQFLKNGYGRLDIFSDPEWLYTYENFFDQKRLGITASYFLGYFKWWETDLFANSYHNNTKSNVELIKNTAGFAFTYEINNKFYLDKDRRYILTLNYWQDLPFYNNNIYNNSYGSLDIGANISLLNKRLNIGVLVTDLAHQSITRSRADYSDYSVKRRDYFDARLYRLSLRYSIGSSSIKALKNISKFEDRERMN